MSKIHVKIGGEYYCPRLDKRVTVLYIANDYVAVVDEDKDKYDVPAHSLKEVKEWTAEEILEREG